MELFSFRNRLLLGGALILICIVVLLASSFLVSPKKPSPPTLPSVSDTYQKAFSTVRRGSSPSSLEKLPGFKDKKPLSSTVTEFSYTSPLLALDNIIQTEKGAVVYTGQVMVDATHKNPSLSPYLAKYGEPDETVVGSKLFGEFAKTFIYPSKGVAFVGNTDTDEVFFFQTFTPTTLTAYKMQFGQDIREDSDHTEPIDPKEEAVRLFKLKLPYFGENIAITYDGAIDKTTVFIKNGDAGHAELEKLLLDNNIPSLSWIKNLTEKNL